MLPTAALRVSVLAVLAASLLAASLLAACAEPQVRKRTFVGQSGRGDSRAEVAVGLNPLGSLDTCRPAAGPQPEQRLVLVSRPEHFTPEASQMIADLREALAQPRDDAPPVRFLLSQGPIATQAEAVDQGRRCGAMIVLWEPGRTKTLRLTLPHPAQIPLRGLTRERLCEFGNHEEQLRILHLTTTGLAAMREHQYDRAVLYLETANRLDDHCLRLPGASAVTGPQAGDRAAGAAATEEP